MLYKKEWVFTRYILVIVWRSFEESTVGFSVKLHLPQSGSAFLAGKYGRVRPSKT
jgi:hypothetical protein